MSYFQFKQFTIQQDQCAMKVCTDACILGAWFAAKIPSWSMVLDIGSGTGLLMEMLAQKTQGQVHGIELDIDSFKQQKENIAASKWSHRLQAFPGDARTYAFPLQYDFIISNPPFFENDLTSSSLKKNIARHSLELTLEDLLKVIARNLLPSGSFGILLPVHRVSYFEQLAGLHQFYPAEKLLVKQTPNHAPFRGILQFSRLRQDDPPFYELTIKNEKEEYTSEFTDLLKDYYLNL